MFDKVSVVPGWRMRFETLAVHIHTTDGWLTLYHQSIIYGPHLSSVWYRVIYV